MSIVVHHLEQSRSHRILWFLEEAGVDYDIVTYARDENFRAPPELARVHPRGRAPAVEWDGRVLAESGAVLETLAEAIAPQLIPDRGSDAFHLHRYFLHYAEGSLMPPLLVGLITGKIADAPVPFFLKPVVRTIAGNVNKAYTSPELVSHARFLEDHLQAHDWFAGPEMGIADIQMSYGVLALRSRAKVPLETPRVQGWLDRIQAREAYKAAIEKGGEPF